MDEQELNKRIDDRLKQQLQGGLFTARKLADTPTDDLMVTPRKYVNLNGAVASRPNSSVATVGQKYFATDTNILMTFNSPNWYNGTGSIVAIN